jgi:hypothetical protein
MKFSVSANLHLHCYDGFHTSKDDMHLPSKNKNTKNIVKVYAQQNIKKGRIRH